MILILCLRVSILRSLYFERFGYATKIMISCNYRSIFLFVYAVLLAMRFVYVAHFWNVQFT